MMISGKELNNVVRAYTRRISELPKRASRASEKPATERTDSIALSDKARELAELQARLGELPEVRSERVAQLKEQVARGEYSVSSEKIAEKVLQRSLADRLASAAERE